MPSAPLPISIGDELIAFLHDIDCLTCANPISMLLLGGVLNAMYKQRKIFIEQKFTTQTDIGEQYNIDFDYWAEWNTLKDSIDDIEHVLKIMPISLIVSLVSRYDAFLSQLIRFLILAKPHIINQSEKSITFQQLVSFDSIERAREHIIDKEIESILRTSHSEQFEWLEKKAEVKLRTDLPIWSRFIEINERRNLFVHTDGIVSGQYIKVCKEHQCTLEEGVTVGTCLSATPKYCNAARDCFYEIAVKLTHVLWRKHAPVSLELADSNMTAIIIELLNDGRYELAQTLLDFTHKYCKFVNDENRRICVVNRAQAYKWHGNNKKALEILSEQDWSATSDKFKLAVAVIKEDFGDACAIMRKIGISDEVPALAYKIWPVFKEFVKKSEFLVTYAEIFSAPFSRLPADEINKTDKPPHETGI